MFLAQRNMLYNSSVSSGYVVKRCKVTKNNVVGGYCALVFFVFNTITSHFSANSLPLYA